MNYTCVKDAVSALRKLEELVCAYDHVMGVTFLDAATAAPKGSYEGRGRAIGVLSQITYDLIANQENGALLDYLEAHSEELDREVKRETALLRKRYDQIHRIPAEEYVAFSILTNDAEAVWEKAKNENDFASFAPYLEKIVDFNRKFAGYYHPELKPYDALLTEYEEGLNTETLDVFFAKIRKAIVPLVQKIKNADEVDVSFLSRHYPIDRQRKFSDYLMELMGLDRDVCAIAESEHPFTTNFNTKDVRITTHYYENALASSMYSVIHEGGHALYELGVDSKYDYTFLSGGVSMGIHESQSRFYENIIGRSEAFVNYIFPKLQEFFPDQLKDVSAHMFYRAVNKAEPSLIRTEADDLTYCLHVMVRYEIEKQLINGNLKVSAVPEKWNALYKEYLGVDVPNDTMGCLLDSLWAGVSIGFFPSYALGSAYGAQMLHVMETQIGSIEQLIRDGKLSLITSWLRQNIHVYGCLIPSDQLIEQVVGRFDADYYANYLTDKYTKLYDF